MFQWTDEQRLLAETVSNFATRELAPVAAHVDETEGWNPEIVKKLGSLGLLGITVSEKFGGSELGALEATLVMEKMAEACASTTLSYLAHSILCVNNVFANGSDEQRQRYLPKLISGEWWGGMGMTE